MARWVFRCAIVEVEVAADASARLLYAVIGPQIDLLIFDAAPEALRKHIVPPSPLPIHADRDLVSGEQAGEGRARKLRALIRVDDLRLAVFRKRLFERLDAEVGFQCDRDPPGQRPP